MEADQSRRWRRTSFRRLDGSVEFAPDDWTLEDPAGQPLARIYRTTGAPRDGMWLWFVLTDPLGRPYNGGTGTAATGTEAREAVEALAPVGARLQAPADHGDGCPGD
jgi:hypothetical protein